MFISKTYRGGDSKTIAVWNQRHCNGRKISKKKYPNLDKYWSKRRSRVKKPKFSRWRGQKNDSLISDFFLTFLNTNSHSWRVKLWLAEKKIKKIWENSEIYKFIFWVTNRNIFTKPNIFFHIFFHQNYLWFIENTELLKL